MITSNRRRLSPILAAALLCTAAAHGQDARPFEVSVGYSYVRANAPPGQCGCFGMNGGSGAFAASMGHGISAVADFGAYFQNNVVGAGRSLNIDTFLFGPRLSSHHWKKWTPFVQALAGETHGNGTLYGSTTTSARVNGFSTNAGGGLDWNVGRNVSLRLFEAEYLLTRLPNYVNNNQNDLRLTFGVVLHFGRPQKR